VITMKNMMPNGTVVPAPAQVLTGPIGKLLIANRGEIASRIMRTAHALGLATVAIYSDPDTIAAMGSKIEAKAIMAAAGVPVLPGVILATAPDYDPGPSGLAAEAARTGFPLLVKAAFGGGGRGMRLVRDPGELAGAVQAARREAASAFGDGTVFLERYVEDPRHVEVQILGDAHGPVRWSEPRSTA